MNPANNYHQHKYIIDFSVTIRDWRIEACFLTGVKKGASGRTIVLGFIINYPAFLVSIWHLGCRGSKGHAWAGYRSKIGRKSGTVY